EGAGRGLMALLSAVALSIAGLILAILPAVVSTSCGGRENCGRPLCPMGIVDDYRLVFQIAGVALAGIGIIGGIATVAMLPGMIPSLSYSDPPGDAYRTVAIDGGTITFSQDWSGDYLIVFEGERDYNATVYLCHFKVDPEKEVALITSGGLAYNGTSVVKSGPIVSYLFDLEGGFLRPLVILDDGTWVMFENIW
ncbi:MAG: hypothetical protein WC343_04600, partial [Bacilli bacterium]